MNEEKPEPSIKIPAHFYKNGKIYASFALWLIGAVFFELNINAIGSAIDIMAFIMSAWFIMQKIDENS